MNAFLSKHGSKILVALGTSMMVGGTAVAIVGTWRLKPKIDYIRRKYVADNSQEAKKELAKEIIKESAPWAIPVILLETSGIACIVGGHKQVLQANATISTAYSISEAARQEYKNHVIEAIGKKKEQAIQDKIAEEHVQNDPISRNQVIITGSGDSLCYDLEFGRYFTSNIEKLRQAENKINARLNSYDYASLNEFYSEIGLPCTQTGWKLGWDRENGLLELGFSSQLAEDGRPCLVVQYFPPPMYKFDLVNK